MRDLARHPRLERRLATLLHGGTWVGCIVIAAGLLLRAIGPEILAPASAMHVVTAGVGIFILLPVLRVALMLVVFFQERDYRFSIIAAVVLAIIVLGAVLGTYVPG